MRLIVKRTRLEGCLVKASFMLDAMIASKRRGPATLIVEDVPVSPQAAAELHYEILDASERELDLLCRSGYGLILERARALKRGSGEIGEPRLPESHRRRRSNKRNTGGSVSS